MLLAVDITDEIFGLSVAQPKRLNPFYTYGMVAAAAPGWALGTFLGVVVGNILPQNIVTVSMAASFALSRLSAVELSAGVRTIILTVAISGAAAFLFPLREERRTNAA